MSEQQGNAPASMMDLQSALLVHSQQPELLCHCTLSANTTCQVKRVAQANATASQACRGAGVPPEPSYNSPAVGCLCARYNQVLHQLSHGDGLHATRVSKLAVCWLQTSCCFTKQATRPIEKMMRMVDTSCVNCCFLWWRGGLQAGTYAFGCRRQGIIQLEQVPQRHTTWLDLHMGTRSCG
jgi:hypothetical protein